MAQGIRSLPPTWKTWIAWMECPIRGSALAQPSPSLTPVAARHFGSEPADGSTCPYVLQGTFFLSLIFSELLIGSSFNACSA